MASFVLVAGAWHGAWCWERIVPLLTARGHTVIAPDLLGTGDDATFPADINLSQWADQIADIVDAQAEPVILVGHNRGGLVISETAERLPHKIAMLVYLTAFLVPSGKTLADIVTVAPVRDDLPAFDHHPMGPRRYRPACCRTASTTRPHRVGWRARNRRRVPSPAPSFRRHCNSATPVSERCRALSSSATRIALSGLPCSALCSSACLAIRFLPLTPITRRFSQQQGVWRQF